jgi:ribosomal protein L31E
MRIQAQLNKQLFYPDEEVILDFLIDNSLSERDIKEIRAKLRYTVTVRKADELL